MHRSVERARRWRYTICGVLLVVAVWTYYMFSYQGIVHLALQEKGVGVGVGEDAAVVDEDRVKDNKNAYELIPMIERNNSNNPSQNSKQTGPQKVVIVISQFGSSSEVAGQVLSTSKGTIYLDEPLLPFGTDCKVLQERKLALLSRILSCDFNELDKQYNAAFRQTRFSDTGDCASKGLCNPYTSFGLLNQYTAICNWIYYRKSTIADFDPKSPSCGFPLKQNILNEQCLNSRIISTKVTRVCSINELQSVYDFLVSKGKEVYVVHLVKDPRSTIHSRTAEGNEGAANITKEVCQRLRTNLETLWNTKTGTHNATSPTLLTDERCLRIRFEDTVLDTTLWAERLYRFIGSEMPPEVKRDIRSHMQQDSEKLKKLLIDKQTTESRKIWDPMSFPFAATNGSKDVLQRWRKTIPWKIVQLVQRECADVMESLEYLPFKDERVLRNASIPFLKFST